MQLRSEHRRKLKLLAERFHIELILLFGSVVRKQLHPKSDFDIAVLLKKNDLPLKEYSELCSKFHGIFQGQDIDLSVMNHADPLFLRNIMENCQLLYGIPQKLRELQIYAFKRFQDHQRYFRMEEDFVRKHLEKLEREND